MSKYALLGRYLRDQAGEKVPMTFSQIERVLGARLPASALRHRAWWSNNPENNVATREWLNAGYETAQVDIEGKRLVFQRVGPARIAEPLAPAWAGPRDTMTVSDAPKNHPLFGALKGTVRIPPGVDLTEPADPEWAKISQEGD